MEREQSFTQGNILKSLLLFALPVLLALFLQAMYGAIDLLIVGKFASSVDVSAVSTGSQIMMTLTNLVSSFAMGTTILLGQQIGKGEKEKGGETVGTAIVMFAVIAVLMTILLVPLAPQVCSLMNAPEEAFDKTVAYVRICGGLRLSEGLCHRLHAYGNFLLLYGIFQRNRKNYFRDGTGNHRRHRRACAGVMADEPVSGRKSFSNRTGNTGILSCSSTALRGVYGIATS